MGANVCKKCRRAYPQYLERCPNCTSDTGVWKPRREATRGRTGGNARVAASPATNAEPLVNAPPFDSNAPALVPGGPCYACGRRVPKTAKQRYQEWKARRLAE